MCFFRKAKYEGSSQTNGLCPTEQNSSQRTSGYQSGTACRRGQSYFTEKVRTKTGLSKIDPFPLSIGAAVFRSHQSLSLLDRSRCPKEPLVIPRYKIPMIGIVTLYRSFAPIVLNNNNAI